MFDDKIRTKLCRYVFIVAALLYLYTSGFGSFSEMTHRALLVAVCGFSVFLKKPFKIGKDKKQNLFTRMLDWLFSVGFTTACIYIMCIWNSRTSKIGEAPQTDIWMGILMIVLLLIASYKTTGLPLVITCIVFLLYAKFGPYLPRVIAHRGESWSRIAQFMYVSTGSIFGIPVSIAATYIISFVIFGAFLERFGAGQWFVDISYAATGNYRGGPAKTSVISSALMGMISGSPAANVVTTGAFTIPLMKRMGYKDYEAAAVESVASTGGMFTPPIMGAAAFLMAEYLNISYASVAKAAILPAILYYISIFLVVDAIAVKSNLLGIPKNELPNAKSIMKERGQLCIPIILVIAGIIIGWSAMKVAFWGTVSVLLVACIKKETRPTLKGILEALESSIKNVSGIVISCAAAGIIVGVISMTGLATKLSYTLINIAHGNIYIAAVLVAFITIILGCGMPPTPTYIILATVLVGPLTKMGASAISAHMFIFMFASIGALTPPVAITAYTAAAIARSDPNKTGYRAFRMGLVAYIIPFIFLLNPALLLTGNLPIVAMAVISSIIGIFALTGAVEGYIFRSWAAVSRILLALAAILLLIPGSITDIIGALLILIAFFLSKIADTKKRTS
ncbi:TRAP transporter fused permease subunit [Treponema parvum]|uniref:TRAP transporter fused permease subunit n=1 Tax=Treponema parvum TaxID=138851 RepID=A0A975ID09_9SPIR|nr:TRAP transporter fused permease subunit [Treponema parvum]QTQ12556.1 TRAP transporter fused permease subunit [Treponema parvum]